MAKKDPFISSLNHWIKLILNEMRYHIMSIIFIVVLYLLLWIVPQTNDLIVVINQADNDWIAVFAFFSSLSVLAFFISTVNTYFNPPEPPQYQKNLDTTLLSNVKSKHKKPPLFHLPKDNKELFVEAKHDLNILTRPVFIETQAEYIKRVFPKILGAILIIIAAYAVNNTYQQVYGNNISFSGGKPGFFFCLFIFVILLYLPITMAFNNWIKRYKWSRYIPIVSAILCLLIILVLGLFNKGGAPEDAERLFYSLILLCLFFLLISLSYDTLILKLKKYFGAPIIILLIMAIFIGYFILVINPQGLKIITPLSIVMICIIGLYTLLNLIKLIGYRTNLPLLGIFILGAIFLAIYNANKPNFTHYDATTTKTTKKPSERLAINSYVDQWILDRKDDILNRSVNHKFPIIMVSSEGGGSRAGLWSFLVQSYLYDRNPEYFEKYLFSMTGASGGGVGNNMFYTQAYNLYNGKSTSDLKYKTLSPKYKSFKYKASTIYNQDYLSTSIASLFGRDLFKSITNLFTFKDRGALLEQEWEKGFKRAFEYPDTSPLAESYLDMMPQVGQYEYIRPLLITNTTRLQSGEYALISPVSIIEDTNNLGVFMDLLAKYPSDSLMIKRSTAMSLNARFPYISPAARIETIGQFGDAGYYDNIGGTVTQRLNKTLVEALEKDSSLVGKYDIKHLLITNYESQSKLTNSSQLVVPPLLVWNATFGHPKEMEKTFTNVYHAESKRTEIPQKEYELEIIEKLIENDSKIKPFIPLGRYLSDTAVHSLEARLEHQEVTTILNRLIPQKTNHMD